MLDDDEEALRLFDFVELVELFWLLPLPPLGDDCRLPSWLVLLSLPGVLTFGLCCRFVCTGARVAAGDEELEELEEEERGLEEERELEEEEEERELEEGEEDEEEEEEEEEEGDEEEVVVVVMGARFNICMRRGRLESCSD